MISIFFLHSCHDKLSFSNNPHSHGLAKLTVEVFDLLPIIEATDMHILTIAKSSRQEVFYKKSVLKHFAKFTGKHHCQSLFFNKVSDLRPATLLKKRLWYMSFPLNFAKFLRRPFL